MRSLSSSPILRVMKKKKREGITGVGVIIILTAASLLSLSLLMLQSGNRTVAADIRDGALSLADIGQDRNILLSGEWRFYGNRFLSPGEEVGDYRLIPVPGGWDEPGYGTYRLEILGLIPGKDYALLVPDNPTAWRLYLDGVPAGSNGVVGTGPETEEIEWHPRVVHFSPRGDKLVLTLHMSNYTAFPGGMIREILLGPSPLVSAEKHRRLADQMILMGGLLIIGLFNFSLFIRNRREWSSLSFSLFCLTMALRIPLTGERTVNIWLPGADWYLLLQLQFISGALLLGFFILYLYHLFKDCFSPAVVIAGATVSLGLTIAALTVPMVKLGPVDTGYLILTFAFFLYSLYALIKAVIRGKQGALFALAGFVFIIGSIILEATLPPGTNALPMGIFIFVIFQSLVISEKQRILEVQNRELNRIAIRDTMTNLYKKEPFIARVDALLSEKAPSSPGHALLFLDLDNFKSVNDILGHDGGDKLLTALSQRLQNSLRSCDMACRYGGDEFVVFLKGASKDTAEAVAERILETISRPAEIKGVFLPVSVSIGISLFPDEADSAEDLIKLSDRRMYRAKRLGKNRFLRGDD